MELGLDGVVPPTGVERRRDRSTDAVSALSRLLDAARNDAALDALAIADASGCLVAGAGRWEACEELAAYAPLLEHPSEPANDVIPTRLDVLARRSEVRRLCVDGIDVLVCGHGESDGRSAALDRAAAGCARILGRSSVRFA